MVNPKTLAIMFATVLALGFAALMPQVSLAGAEADQALSKSADSAYDSWKKWYERVGGDRQSSVSLGPIRGISPSTGIRGSVSLNLIDGTVSASLRRLDSPVDLWLIDNQEGPGKSFLPEEGDRMVLLGRVEPGSASVSKTFGDGFFKGFELDLIVASAADAKPTDSLLLVGSRSSFERRYTRERTIADAPVAVSSHGDFSAAVDPRVALGLVSQDVLEGGDLFFRGTFEGNGRSCGTCHPPENNLVTDPADIQARLARDTSDPLFVALPEFTGQFPVPRLERPDLLVGFGMILENVDGFEDPGVKFIMRSVPHNLSMATSLTPPGPRDDPPQTDADGNVILADGSTDQFVQRTGWSGDGVFEPGTLRLFPVGAVIQHYTRDFDIREPGPDSFRLQTDDELDKIEAFLLSTGRLADIDFSLATLSDAGADNGRVIFASPVGKCFGCHNNGGANSAFVGNRNFDTGVETVRLATIEAQGLPRDGGFGGQGLVGFDHDADFDGTNDSFGDGGFNVPPVIEAADTGPFFHTNAFETIEDAVGFYSSDAFNNSPAAVNILNAVFGEGINLTQEQNDDVAAFLRVANAAFNIQIAVQRVDAARRIGSAFGSGERPLANTLLRLAIEELRDARQVLRERNLNTFQRLEVEISIILLETAVRSNSSLVRSIFTAVAQEAAEKANDGLGDGIDFTMGQGNLVF